MNFTLVKTHFKKECCNHRLRFGSPVHTVRLDRQSVLCAFEEGANFGYIRWSSNAFGTVNWQVIIAGTRDQKSLTKIPGIYPGAEIYYRARGVIAARKTLNWLDKVERKSPISLEEIPLSFWRKAENARIIRAALPIYKTRTLEPFHA